MPLRLLLLTLAALLPGACAEAQPPASSPAWSARVEDDATPSASIDGTTALSAGLHFWGPDWAYAHAEFRVLPRQGGVLPVQGRVDALGLTFDGAIDDRDPARLVWSLRCTAQRDLTGLIGAGIEFNPDVALGAAAGAGTPEFLPDQRGWRWPAGTSELRVEFAQPLAELYFERGDTSRIRCMFIGSELAAGDHDFSWTISLPPGAAVARPLAERYAAPDDTWKPDTLPFDAWPVDFRPMNDRVAGERGFVSAIGDRLVFADGTDARFWGVNIQAYALFHATDEAIALQAERLAALGFNLVRIHHHDSRWVDPNVFGPAPRRRGALDDASLDRIDAWVAQLKQRGIYTWLDLHVGREFLPAENIPGESEIARNGGQAQGFAYVNERLEQLMGDFARDYLARTNRYTGLRYIDEPAVLGVLITNENDLTTHFGNLMLPDKDNPYHHRLFSSDVRTIAKGMGLDPDDAMRTWEPGASKLVMNEIERGFFDRSIRRLRSAGLRVPIATTNFWGGMSLHGLASLTVGDVIDVHSYGTEEALSTDPRRQAHWLHWIACAQAEGKPLTISEWNVPYPIRDRFTAPLWMAATAAYQGWDAPMLYGYVQEPLRPPGRAGPWSAWSDPALMALMPAAAVLYRDAHIATPTDVTVFAPSREDAYFTNSNPDHVPALRTLAESTRLSIRLPDTPELTWDTPAPTPGATIVRDPSTTPLSADATSISTPDTQISRDWRRGILTINSPRSQAASGWIGGEPVQLAELAIASQTPAATIALTSLDNRPLASSTRILLTTVAQAVAPGDALPFRAEPVVARIRLRTSIASLSVVPLMPYGQRGDPLPTRSIDGWLEFDLDGSAPGHWHVIEGPPAP